MVYRFHCAALLATTTLGATFSARHASAQVQAIAPLSAPGERLPDAQFGAVRVNESRASTFGDLISSKNIERQIKDLDGPLSFREGSLGFYDVSFEATGNRGNGQVRVLVTIVGQSNGQTILARGQGVQEWQDFRWLYPAPAPQTPDIYPPTEGAPRAARTGYFVPKLVAFAICQNKKRVKGGDARDARDAKIKEEREAAAASERKPDEKPAPAPNPSPRRDAGTKDASPRNNAPAPNPPSRRDDKDSSPRVNAPDPNPPTRRDTNDSPLRPRPYVPTSPAPRPQFPSGPRASTPDPNPPTRGKGNGSTSAPDPNPPSAGTVTIGPDPNPPSRGGVYYEPRPWRGPVWDNPYDRYPYPYPVPYPYPYPYPYPAPYPYPNVPTAPNSDEGARQAFDYALLQARAQAEADFKRQLRGESLDER